MFHYNMLLCFQNIQKNLKQKNKKKYKLIQKILKQKNKKTKKILHPF
jgi:hypothetical protein